MRLIIGAIAGVMATVGVAAVVYFGAMPWHSKTESVQAIHGALKQVNDQILMRQTNHFSAIVEEQVITKAVVYFKWRSDDAWGVSFGSWSPEPALQDGTLSLSVPPLVYFGPNVDLVNDNDTRTVNGSLLISEERIKDEFKVRMYEEICERALSQLQSQEFRDLARQSLQGFLFNLLGAINGLEEPIRQVEITFAKSNGLADASGRCS